MYIYIYMCIYIYIEREREICCLGRIKPLKTDDDRDTLKGTSNDPVERTRMLLVVPHIGTGPMGT